MRGIEPLSGQNDSAVRTLHKLYDTIQFAKHFADEKALGCAASKVWYEIVFLAGTEAASVAHYPDAILCGASPHLRRCTEHDEALQMIRHCDRPQPIADAYANRNKNYPRVEYTKGDYLHGTCRDVYRGESGCGLHAVRSRVCILRRRSAPRPQAPSRASQAGGGAPVAAAVRACAEAANERAQTRKPKPKAKPNHRDVHTEI